MGYELFLAVHVVCAVVWVGGGVSMQVLAVLAERANDGPRMATFAKDAEWIGTHIYLPASLLLLGAGIALVLIGQWGFGTLWVALGIAGFASSVVIGAAFTGPAAKKLAPLLEERGPNDPEVRRRMQKIFTISRVETVILLLVVVDMTMKPGSGG